MIRKRLTKEQIERIKKLYSEGVSTYDLARMFEVTQTAIHYWVKSRDKMIEDAKKRFKNKTPEQKKEAYESRKEYHKNYFKERYANDPIFREKHKERCRRNK